MQMCPLPCSHTRSNKSSKKGTVNRNLYYYYYYSNDVGSEVKYWSIPRFYKHTYGTAQCNSVELKFPERTVDGHRLRSRLRSLQRAAAAAAARPATDPDMANITSGRLLERLRELEQLRHPSSVIDALQPAASQLEGQKPDDDLYSQVAQSIGLFNHNLRATNVRLRGRQTPEYASAPGILSAAPLSARSSKSSDTYIGYLERQRPATDGGKGTGPASSCPPQPAQNATIAENRLLQIVVDCNTPEPTTDPIPCVRQEHIASSGDQPQTDVPSASSKEQTASDASVPGNKPPGCGIRKAAIVAPPRKHKTNAVRVACRPVVRKELTIVVPMV